jgi:hypothetical protein
VLDGEEAGCLRSLRAEVGRALGQAPADRAASA